MKISTSILSTKDSIEESLKKLNETSTDYLHLDVMDGKFVRNNTVNIMDEALEYNKLPLDIHLMVEDIDAYIEKYQVKHPVYMTFHIEIAKDINHYITKLKDLGIKVGIAINPETDIQLLNPYLKDIDLVLVMSVTPGKGGQEFQQNALNHIHYLIEQRQKYEYQYQIEVDGGINDNTISLVKNVDIVVSGSYIILGNYEERIQILKSN